MEITAIVCAAIVLTVLAFKADSFRIEKNGDNWNGDYKAK
jgi:hypothetical protein